jgi:hypothetical protein
MTMSVESTAASSAEATPRRGGKGCPGFARLFARFMTFQVINKTRIVKGSTTAYVTFAGAFEAPGLQLLRKPDRTAER